MRKIISLIFLMILLVVIFFGNVVVAQAQHEWKDFYFELNSAVRRFCSVTAS